MALDHQDVRPSFADLQSIYKLSAEAESPPDLVPVCLTIPADLLTPAAVYLKVSSQTKFSFLLESAGTTETIGRYSFIGANPTKVLKTGPGHGPETDPLPILSKELSQHRLADIPSLKLPPLNGAVGYISYDCVKYFEPKTARDLRDDIHLPESLFMLFDTIITFDHFFSCVKIVHHLPLPPSSSASSSELLKHAYEAAKTKLFSVLATITAAEVPLPPQPSELPHYEYSSNIGQKGYEAHVTKLKQHINKGDIIQAVPSHRVARPTSLHPFNIYRSLRNVNPSPYLFYLDCEEFQLVGASPEVLVKSESRMIITHPIAGTIGRGLTSAQDERLSRELQSSLKDRAEHVMLVDLARNDVNRVCDPLTTKVDKFLIVQKFSHVQHLVSEVSGIMRPDKTRFDAFRSIFPAGTTSGAPKVRAMELIAELEGEKRGAYAGSAGYFGYDTVQLVADDLGRLQSEMVEEGSMDTCIMLRTMLVKDGVAYLQAGGGIVFDSDETDEWVETMNKLGANMRCIELAENQYRAGRDKVLIDKAVAEARKAQDQPISKQKAVNGA